MNENRIVLSLSSDYLSHWDLNMALRELYQNAVDRQVEGYKMKSDYDIDNYVLYISNENTTIDKKSLILGSTSKKGKEEQIGQFGEGYKLALLILARLGKEVAVYNGNEIWHPHLAYNDAFDTELLTIDIEQAEMYQPNLTFMIDVIEPEEYLAYTYENLYLQGEYEKINVENCEVLLDVDNRGKLFINGLYICPYHGNTLYGYNFASNIFKLGRDRQMVDGFNASWEASSAVVKAFIKDKKVLKKVVETREDKYDDTKFIASQSSSILVKAFWEAFSEEHPGCLPVKGTLEADLLAKKYVDFKFAVVNETQYDVLIKSDGYKSLKASLTEKPAPEKPTVIVNRFYDNHIHEMSAELKESFAKELMVEAVNWEVSDD